MTLGGGADMFTENSANVGTSGNLVVGAQTQGQDPLLT